MMSEHVVSMVMTKAIAMVRTFFALLSETSVTKTIHQTKHVIPEMWAYDYFWANTVYV